jgi:hypothetical protein
LPSERRGECGSKKTSGVVGVCRRGERCDERGEDHAASNDECMPPSIYRVGRGRGGRSVLGAEGCGVRRRAGRRSAGCRAGRRAHRRDGPPRWRWVVVVRVGRRNATRPACRRTHWARRRGRTCWPRRAQLGSLPATLPGSWRLRHAHTSVGRRGRRAPGRPRPDGTPERGALASGEGGPATRQRPGPWRREVTTPRPSRYGTPKAAESHSRRDSRRDFAG